MDLIREHLIYKNVPTTICMKDLKPVEQYEAIRLILATKATNVSICKHDSTNEYIDQLLTKLSVTFVDCSSSSSS